MKQIILKNNVIEIYKKLKNDKEKSQFLLKIFKFLVENDESFEAKDKINLAFMGIKPSLKMTESGGGNNNPSGKNQHNEEDTLTSDDLGQPLNKCISVKEYKNISNKDISNKDIKSCGVVNSSDKKEKMLQTDNTQTPQTTTPQLPLKFKKISDLDTFKEWWDWWEYGTDTEIENFCKQHNITDDIKFEVYDRIVAYCERTKKDYDDYRRVYMQSLLNKQNGGTNG